MRGAHLTSNPPRLLVPIEFIPLDLISYKYDDFNFKITLKYTKYRFKAVRIGTFLRSFLLKRKQHRLNSKTSLFSLQ